ncbi:MAG: chemotaxis protein CheW [Archangium sp.]|nr:chemotaxis protein CheW [Archangium sp.]
MSRDRAEVLRVRARALAQRPDVSTRKQVARVVSLRAGGQLFGVPVEAVDVLLPVRPVAHLPELPPWLPGVVQVRGDMVSVLDLAQWFKVPDPPSPQVLALIHHEGRRLALCVDEVLGFRDVFADELAAELIDAANSRPVLGMTRDLQILLDVPALFRHPDVAPGGA